MTQEEIEKAFEELKQGFEKAYWEQMKTVPDPPPGYYYEPTYKGHKWDGNTLSVDGSLELKPIIAE